MSGQTTYTDRFVLDRMPHPSTWPELKLGGIDYPAQLNAAVELTDAMVGKGFGDSIALIGHGRRRTYKELSDWTNRLANALVDDIGLRPGNRVLIRSANNPAMVACWLAATKAGAVVVNSMPMLRAGELKKYIELAEIEFALCDTRLLEEMELAADGNPFLKRIIGFDGTPNHAGELDELALEKPVSFEAVATAQDDVALIGFTSGSTGEPKGTMHFHRDLLIIADTYAKEVLGVRPDDVFIGSPPLAFTFGLGGLAIFPLRFGAAAALLDAAPPLKLVEYIQRYKATICFTAPTAYRAMMGAIEEGADLSSLRIAVSAGETLPEPVYQDWQKMTGLPMLDGIGATEMLHIFISNRLDDHKPACTGKPVTGYEARVVDENGNEVPRGEMGRLAVRGPTGCRYLNGTKQDVYVQKGWNITGDTFVQDDDGYFRFAARNDDIILSSGYNIAGPEVEAALLSHQDVAECAVIGIPDPERGAIVQAHVVLNDPDRGDQAMGKALQDHVKAVIAPYKYPRSICFVTELPKTSTGKIQRFKLKSD